MNDNKHPEMPSATASDDRRTRRLYRLWRAMPFLFLLALVGVVIILNGVITKREARLAAEKAAAVKTERPPVNVVVQRLEPETIHDRISLPGEIEPWIRLKLLSEIHGRVVAIPVREGQRVEKGDVLVQVDDRDYRIRVASTEASLKLAEDDLRRAQDLFERGLIPKAELDRAETQATTLRAARDDARLDLERCTIRASFAGVVNRVDADLGLLLAIGDPVGELLRVDRVKAVIGIPESDVPAVRNLETVQFTIQALGNRQVTGQRYFLSSAPETFARVYRLELAVDNPGGDILPGMFVRADVVKRESEGALAVPLYAVVSRQGGHFVFVENGGKAHRRPVEIGILDGWRVEVRKGLEAGDRVIVVGHRSVEDGQGVAVVREVADAGELLR